MTLAQLQKQQFEKDGFVFERQLIEPSYISALMEKMRVVVRNQLNSENDGDLDACFAAATEQSISLRSNLYTTFGTMVDLPKLLASPLVEARLIELGFEVASIQTYSIFCIEPTKNKHLFLPHQDLRGRTSKRSLGLWIPLSADSDIGGMGVYKGTHKNGPIVHQTAETGQVYIEQEHYEKADTFDCNTFDVGDVLMFDPYLIHYSIPNTGSKVRWTAIIKIDDMAAADHLGESLHPFDAADFVDLRSNKERLALANS